MKISAVRRLMRIAGKSQRNSKGLSQNCSRFVILRNILTREKRVTFLASQVTKDLSFEGF